MAIIKREVCDVCLDVNKPTKKYRLGTNDTLKRMSLCDVHGKPLADLLARGRGRNFQVTTPEELEERLAEQKSLSKPRVQGKVGLTA